MLERDKRQKGEPVFVCVNVVDGYMIISSVFRIIRSIFYRN